MGSPSADGLNRAQRTAVTTLSGPLLVLAGAGTGKTRVITFRIAELIKGGISPHRILAVTFTNKAAKEMRSRATALLGGRRRKQKQKGPEISTFHSLCVRILRRNAKLLGYPENFTIYDRGDQETIARNALRDIRVGAQKLKPSDLIQMISAWKGQGISPKQAEDLAHNDRELLASQAYEKYQVGLRTCGAMDFDDLLACTERLFEEHPGARYAESSRFDHLLIDEYQDTSQLQYRIMRALAERHRNICVVGDDDQSIYGWRGAEVEHILAFKDQWPDARVVRLEENYRSSGWIIHLANTLIGHNSLRHDKVLRAAKQQGKPPRFVAHEDENHEAEAVVNEIFRKVNRTDDERVVPSDIAILFRTNEQPRAFEQEMRRNGIPYRLVGGQSFYDRKEIKDLLSYLRVLANPSDEVSLLRIINTPPRGIGPSSVQTLVDDAVRAGKPLWDLLPTALEHPDIPQGASLAVEDFRRTMDEFRSRLGDEPLSDLVAELIGRVNYRAEIERQYKEASDQEARWNAVQELVNAVATYQSREEEPSLLGFLEESTLSDRDDDKEGDRKEHAVTLMTLHSAKGLEFRQVYLVGLEEGLLPHKRSLLEDVNTIPEERRLAYVGVTRAQEELSLSFCKARMKWGKLRPQIPSRFLMEMRGETEKAKAIAAQAEQQFAAEARSLEAKLEQENPKPKGKKSRGTGREGSKGRVAGSSSEPAVTRGGAPKSAASPSPSPSSAELNSDSVRRVSSAMPPQAGGKRSARAPLASCATTPDLPAKHREAPATRPRHASSEAVSPFVHQKQESAPVPNSETSPRALRPAPLQGEAHPEVAQNSPSPPERTASPSQPSPRRNSQDYQQVKLFGE